LGHENVLYDVDIAPTVDHEFTAGVAGFEIREDMVKVTSRGSRGERLFGSRAFE
jgi:hypothetical protein